MSRMKSGPAAPNRTILRTMCATIIAPTVLFGSAAIPAHAAEADQVNLNIIGITDFHGHLSQVEKDGAVKEMGAATLACYVNQERAENPHTAFVSAGDNIGGSPFQSSILQDKPTLDALNAMGMDASAPGNHEFDKGWEDLRDRVTTNGTGQAKFPYVATNVEGSDMEPYVVKDYDGVNVAFVGSVTDQTPSLVSPQGVEGLTFTDPISTVKDTADELKQSGQADVVIALVHEGVEPVGFGDNVDAVVAGHTHALRDVEGEPPVIQPNSYGMDLADIDVVYDKAEKEVVKVTASNKSAQEVASACPTPDAAVESIVTAAQEAAEAEGSKVVTTMRNGFFRGTNNGGESGSNRGVESSLNSLLADATLYGVNKATDLKADIGVMNAGGVRADLPAGEVTFSDAYLVQPFGNSTGVVEITGADFKEALEQQWQPGQSRPMLILGLSENVQFTYDPEAEHGNHVTSVTVDGEPLDPAKNYRIAGSTFLLGGGDNFTAFAKNDLVDSGQMDIDVFNTYLRDHSDIAVRDNQTSVGVRFTDEQGQRVAAEEVGALAGQEVTVDLTSLSYTSGEKTPQSAEITIVGDEEATTTAQVDNTIIDNSNETGKATATLKVPAGATELRVKTDNGTTVQLPLGGATDNPGQPEPAEPGNSVAGSIEQLLAGTDPLSIAAILSFLIGGVLAVLGLGTAAGWGIRNLGR